MSLGNRSRHLIRLRADEECVRADLELTVPDERLDDALLRAASASLHVGSRA